MLRDARERLLQTLAFEAGALVLFTPVVWAVGGGGAAGSAGLLVVLAGVLMAWSALHNTLFDRIEWRLARRAASDRPARWRALHALSHEATAVTVSWPVIVGWTVLGWREALWADLGLTALDALYAYGFHRAYDRLRPVRPAPAA